MTSTVHSLRFLVRVVDPGRETMSRWWIQAAGFAAIAMGCGVSQLSAQNTPYDVPSSEANPTLGTSPIPQRGAPASTPMSAPIASRPTNARPAAQAAATASSGVVQQAGYVRLGAPMYPSPRPNVPVWTGGTMITSPALAPHEMLYPHTYRAMYPPFYHRVKGKYFWTPFGTRSHEKWELQGTLVQVKYRSAWPIIGPHKPVISEWGGPWY